MARISLNKLPRKQRIKLIEEFYDIISSLENREEVKAFCRDLFTPDEIAMLMRRIEIAALLWAGFTNEDVQRYTGAGRATVTAVSKKINRDDREGYEIIVKKLLKQRKEKMQRGNQKKKIQESEWQKTKERYSLMFLFSHVLDLIEDRREMGDNEFTKEAVKNTPSNPNSSMD